MIRKVSAFLAYGLLAALLFSGCKQKPGVELLSPQDGRTLNTNIPELAWTGAEADTFEVWVNGMKEATITNGSTHFVPFPLGVGEHSWKVVAVQNGRQLESEMGRFTVEGGALLPLPENATLLQEGWKVRSSHFVSEDGAALSQGGSGTESWHTTSLPATALTALVRNGVYPNPYVGMQNLRIPDLSDEFNAENDLLKYSHIEGQNPWKKPYWYQKSFSLPESYAGQNVWLHFQEINYKANIWLNGVRIADTAEVKGIDHPFKFNVTGQLEDGANYLAVEIYPPDHPGVPSPPPDSLFHHPGRNMGDGAISRDYTRWDVIGWDWIPGVRDRVMGITEDVYLTGSGSVKIADVHIGSELELPDLERADVTVAVKLLNQSDETISGSVSGSIQPKSGGETVPFSSEVTLRGGEEQWITFSPTEGYKQLSLQDPKVWWTHDLGTPHLYSADVSFEAGETVTDKVAETFGIREIETFMDDGIRGFRLNGKKVYARGGNWVNDMMMTWTPARFEQELKYAANANLNLLRVWGPDGAPPEAFFEAADKFGVMIQQDFLFDYWGTYNTDPAYRPPRDLYRENTVALVKRLRNHPSLVFWCGGNEGRSPFEDMITQEILPEYDNLDTRVYLTTSNGDGLAGGGPYHTVRPEVYFQDENIKGFNSEIGPSGMPVANSLYHFLPELGLKAKEGRFPLYDDWGYHSANDRTGSDPRKFSSYDNIVRDDYGQIQQRGRAGVDEYAMKSQLVNYNAYRSSLEAINSHLWDITTGFALWKYNSSWPDIQWQVFDWYQQPHAGYYATQAASEPVHIQYNFDSRDISVINSRLENQTGLRISAELFDLRMNSEWSERQTVDVPANSELETGWTLPEFSGDPRLLNLKITGPDGQQLSKNFYWLDDNNDFRPLFELPEVELAAEVSVNNHDGGRAVKVALQNNSEQVAFFTHVKLVEAGTDKEVLPSFWSNNYVSLLPGESTELAGEVSSGTYAGELDLVLVGFNVKKLRITAL